jgi:hypothetical protein
MGFTYNRRAALSTPHRVNAGVVVFVTALQLYQYTDV